MAPLQLLQGWRMGLRKEQQDASHAAGACSWARALPPVLTVWLMSRLLMPRYASVMLTAVTAVTPRSPADLKTWLKSPPPLQHMQRMTKQTLHGSLQPHAATNCLQAALGPRFPVHPLCPARQPPFPVPIPIRPSPPWDLCPPEPLAPRQCMLLSPSQIMVLVTGVAPTGWHAPLRPATWVGR